MVGIKTKLLSHSAESFFGFLFVVIKYSATLYGDGGRVFYNANNKHYYVI